MRSRTRWLPIALACAFWPAARALGSVVVNSWSLSAGVSGPGAAGQSVFFNKVALPFADQHSASYSNSTASASYDFSAPSVNFLDFSISALMTGEGSPPVFSSGAGGSISISTTVPLLLSVDARFSYDLSAPGDRESSYRVAAGNTGLHAFLAGGGAQTVFGDPPIDTLTAHGDSILLPANATYGLTYEFELFSYSGSPSLLSYATGSVHFRLEPAPVPEPATMYFLAATVPLLYRRRP